VLRSLNIRVVLVHGASAQIKALGETKNIKPSNLDGTGVTDADTLQLAMDAANRLTHEILEGLSTNDLRAACPNAIIAQCPVSAHAALQVRRKLNLNTRIALVAHFNHSEAEEYRQLGDLPCDETYRHMLGFENAVLQDVDQVIYVSEWARRIVESQRSIRPRRSSVIHNGIPDIASPPALTRAALGLREDDLVLINVGTLEPRKNQLNLLALFAEIHKQHPHARLLLVGEGSHRRHIESAIRALHLGDAVKLLGSRQDVHDLLCLSDLYLHYATLENCPVVLLECGRAGLPFAAVPVGGIPELQAAMNVTLNLDPARVTDSLAVLKPFLAAESLRKLLGSRARAAFESRFTTDAMTRAYLAALDLAPEGGRQ
jgi:glycosyltransferase involved in cell wall biosynthesis